MDSGGGGVRFWGSMLRIFFRGLLMVSGFGSRLAAKLRLELFGFAFRVSEVSGLGVF